MPKFRFQHRSPDDSFLMFKPNPYDNYREKNYIGKGKGYFKNLKSFSALNDYFLKGISCYSSTMNFFSLLLQAKIILFISFGYRIFGHIIVAMS